ncbi:MAG TPA: hypothetical protein VM658_21280 [bacterium]|nr:hypothetical protein [bacterium]
MTEKTAAREHGLREGIRTWGLALIVSALCLGGTMFLPGRARGADIYKYADERGVVHIVQSLDEVPPAYRGKAVKVSGSVSVIKGGGNGSNSEGGGFQVPEALKGLFGEAEDVPAPTASRTRIVISELWRSRLGVSAFFAALFFAVLVAGQVLARDVVKKSKRFNHRALLAASFLAFVFFLWLGPAGRQTARFLEGCRERSEQGLMMPGIKPAERERLARFRNLCSRWEDRMEGAGQGSGS